MAYVSWSDGSLMDDGKTYIAYVILDSKKRELIKYKAEVMGINTSYEAEFAAMYYLFKKIIELKLTNIEIFTDCLTLYTNLKKKKRKNMRLEEDLVKRMENKFGKRNVKKLLEVIHWKRREYNLAHPLFLSGELPKDIHNFTEEFGKMIRTSKRYRRQNPVEFQKKQKQFLKKQNMEKMCWAGTLTITNKVGTFKLPIQNMSAASKFLNTKSQVETLKKIEKKMEKAQVETKNGISVYKKGRMEIQIEKGVITEVRVIKRNYIEQYKEKGNDFYKEFDLENVIKRSKKCTEVIELEGIKYNINKRAYNAVKKKVGEEKIYDFLKKHLENSMLIETPKAKVYIKGEVHIVVQKNTIINLTFLLSNHSKNWMKKQKSA